MSNPTKSIVMYKWINTYVLTPDASRIGSVLERFGNHMKEVERKNTMKKFLITIKGKSIPEQVINGETRNFQVSIEVEADC